MFGGHDTVAVTSRRVHDVIPESYRSMLDQLKTEVRAARATAQRSVNVELVRLYWRVGRAIVERQEHAPWGSGVLTKLAADLRAEFPDMRGFSRSNLASMRRFAETWPDGGSIVQQPVGRLPWGHVVALLNMLSDQEDRDWYAAKAEQEGWSRHVLEHHIRTRSRSRAAVAPANFDGTLPEGSALARELTKDPYVLDFLSLDAGVSERLLEQRLVDRIVETLRELGRGFAFVGRQVHFDVDGEDFFVDLLFFHVDQLR